MEGARGHKAKGEVVVTILSHPSQPFGSCVLAVALDSLFQVEVPLVPDWSVSMSGQEDLERNQNSSDALDSIMLDLLRPRSLRACLERMRVQGALGFHSGPD